MPIYNFKCPECGHELEQLMKMDDPWPKCPKCNWFMEKRMSITSFILNGNNWEKDGYGLRSKKKGGK